MLYTVFLCVVSVFVTPITISWLNKWSFGKWYVLMLFAIAIFKHIIEKGGKYEQIELYVHET